SGVVVTSINHPVYGTAPDIGALEFGVIPWQAGVNWSPSFYPWIQHFGVEERLTSNNLTIYPNPAKDGFKIKGVWIEGTQLDIYVYDQTGKLRIKQSLTYSSDSFVSTKDLTTGSYFVAISFGAEQLTKKLLVIN
ncbi:MAG: T9SS type A sorting domain-containing protein, partial [Schleiferiaceae bacterium]